MKKIFILLGALCLLCLLCLASCGEHGHNFNKWEVVAAPTCEETGIERSICSCGAESEREASRLGHSAGERVVISAPTCEKDGAYEIRCVTCGELIEGGRVSSLGHDMRMAEARAATCADVGFEAHEYCARCGFADYDEIPRLPHVAGRSPTCTAPQECKRCGEILAPAKGHTEQAVVGKRATCTRKGLSDGIVCMECDEVLLKQTELPKIAHVPVTVEGRDATCARSGRTDEVVCSECGEVLVLGVEIPLRAHDFGGALGSVCDSCGCYRSGGAGECIHERQIVLEKRAATCESYGLTQGVICNDCGEVLIEQNPILPLAHRPKTVTGRAATDDCPGLTDGKTCLNCRLILEPQQVLPRLSRRG